MEPYLGEIRMFTWNWAPKGWMLCNGALLPIQQYSALFALLGTTYGGNGQTNFALPDLRGRLPMHRSTDGAYQQGQMSGVEQVTIIQSTMAMHNHLLLGTTTAGDKKPPKSTLAASPPDPLGQARWLAPLGQGSSWPPSPWLPIKVAPGGSEIFVDWAYFGAGPLTEPFFEGSIRRALSHPFNALFRYRMTLRDFLAPVDSEDSLQPSGFILHMSRCGSTLAAQMLAALPQNIVVSEAAPIDAVVQLARRWPQLPAEQHSRMLAAMIAAYGRRRAGDERHYFVKLDSWHTLALPLFARAFPSVPWVFLYREPVEVLVSQMHQRGTQMVPEFMPPALYGIEGADGMASEEYCARVLEKICRAVVDHVGDGRGLLINYRELPEALFTKVLPHFGMTFDDSERETMRLAAQRDAKAPSFTFAVDAEAKQRQASEQLRALAERHLGAVYRELEALRVP